MAVYMIRAGADGPVKIGVTNDTLRRLRGLQTGHPARLQIIRVLNGDVATEKILHARFAALRGTGEWFTFAPEMLADDIGFADLPVPTSKRSDLTGVRGLIDSLGGATSVSRSLRMQTAAVGNWSMRDAIPREHHIAVWRLAMAKAVDWTPPDAEGLTLIPAPPVRLTEAAG